MAVAVLTSKGQITIPVEIRNDLGLKAGDKLEFERNEGTATYTVKRKTRSVMDLCGSLKHDGPPLTLEQIDEAIADALAEDEERIKREWRESH